MPSESRSAVPFSYPVPTIPYSQSADGRQHNACNLVIEHWSQERPCVWCGRVFSPKYPAQLRGRFCGRSCSAKWRMRQPEILAKVHSPEVAAKRGERRSAWLQSGDPKAKAEIERITALNPTSQPEVREKISRRLKAMQHAPSVRGGNGTGLTEPQAFMLAVLGSGWIPEYALSLGRRTPGYPTHYKLDLALPHHAIAIEVDGLSHHSRRDQDLKKDEKLASLGWIVLRFWNRDILTWRDLGMPTGSSISMTLAEHGIQVLPFADS